MAKTLIKRKDQCDHDFEPIGTTSDGVEFIFSCIECNYYLFTGGSIGVTVFYNHNLNLYDSECFKLWPKL